ncbi:hypothetical protein GXW83_11780 [Streptacidiphilus sp. PB12-B1b]|uniref:hypothetical protein n=1 Tax=Streptacidiphilus sp. PB12-B1b TaxID=2705012 RepID=UPI0015FAE61B|nr:hypothetical protein [Streptacidiphilus sp. PB12-B1b]QMU76320.1 hypothetical protein GXW83_11780 [Streptacidiphilus sp. PB12-B1b]
MPWVIVSVVGLSTAGLLVLGVLAVRVYAEAARLAGELDAAGRRISQAAVAVERAAEPVARRAGDLLLGEPGPT